MEEIFGVDTDRIMIGVVIGFLLIIAGIGTLALLNRIVLKIGLRNIPRRPAQTALIVVGLMLSTLIISSALGTGDTMNHSIKLAATKGLGEIDEILTASLASDLSSFDSLTGSSPYFPMERVDELRGELEGYDKIDGIAPLISERAPIANLTSQQNVGRMNIVGIEAADPGMFGQLTSTDGAPLDSFALSDDKVYVNDAAREELGASIGDALVMYLERGPVNLEVIGIAANGGTAGDDPTALISIPQAQTFFDHPSEVNSVAISNRGDASSGAALSDEVTEHLRSLLTDQQVALRLKDLLNRPEVVDKIRSNAEDLPDATKEDMLEFADLIEAEELDSKLVSYLGDDALSAQALIALEETTDDPTQVFTAFALLGDLKTLTVQDIKSDLLDFATTIASGILSIFIIMGLFSMMAGVMLIFLIFVMLAAERKPEMGIARAVGMRRRHLVQSFIYEGLAYDLISALVGALLGIGVGLAMVSIMANIFASDEDGFELVMNYRWQSFLISYCLGVVLTFITVFFSSYRASRLNIVAAIRDLPDVLESAADESRLRTLLQAIVSPFISFGRAWTALRQGRNRSMVSNLLFGIFKILPPVWAALILWAVARISTGAISKGWLTFALGVALAVVGLTSKQQAPFTIGVTIALIGVGLMLRWLFDRPSWDARRQTLLTGALVLLIAAFWLGVGIANGQVLTIVVAAIVAAFEIVRQVSLSREAATVTDLESRNAFTFVGLALMLFWGTPFDSLDWIVPEMSGSIEMFFVSGVCLVLAPVWVIVYNSDLITDAMTAVFGRYSRLRPALKTAIAYPPDSRLRTGLTLAMLALVIFTLIVMSMLNTAFSDALSDVDSVTGGWDIVGVVSYNNPIDDIESVLPSALEGDASKIAAVGGYTSMPVEMRQVGAENQRWQSYTARGADTSYLDNTGHKFKIIADGYGATEEEVWAELRDNPNLAVIDALAVPSRDGGGFNFGGPAFRVEGLFFEDEEMEPIEIQIRDPQEGGVTTVTVIGVMDALTDHNGVVMFSKSVLDGISPEPLPITTYRFIVTEDTDAKSIATRLDSAFFENGLETSVLEEELAEAREQNLGINRLLQGFMASGLLVGIAALGVISLRAVVERRQQIGVLRAIGYRRGMVMASFLMESSFVALLGILLGVGLGSLLSYNLVQSIGEDIPGLKFTIPWLQIGSIVAIAYAFSLLTTFLPARQASRIYPAEALRYE